MKCSLWSESIRFKQKPFTCRFNPQTFDFVLREQGCSRMSIRYSLMFLATMTVRPFFLPVLCHAHLPAVLPACSCLDVGAPRAYDMSTTDSLIARHAERPVQFPIGSK